MRSIFLFILTLGLYTAGAQTLTNITPGQARQGQWLQTNITSSSLIFTNSTPQGNIQDILLRNSVDSTYALSDSTKVVINDAATTFWNIPAQIHTGIYDLIVRIYNTVSQTITDYALNSSFTISSPVVWPGDANDDHLVDLSDLLPIGLAYDSTGPSRQVQGNVWQADTATNWPYFFSTGSYSTHVNYSSADCNGDGIVNFADTVAILQNFSLTHAKTNAANTPWRSGLPGLTFRFSKDTLYAGDTLTVTFYLGDSATTVSHFYGLSFIFNYDNTAVDSAFTSSYFGNSWLGAANEKMSISKVQHTQSEIKTAITRITHTQVTGSGAIGTATFKITTDNISGKDYSHHRFVGWISDVKAVDERGNPVIFNTAADTTIVSYYPSGISDIKPGHQMVYPNPANNSIIMTCDDMIKDASLINESGQVVYHRAAINSKKMNIDLSAIADGVYFVKIQTERGTTTHRISVIK